MYPAMHQRISSDENRDCSANTLRFDTGSGSRQSDLCSEPERRSRTSATIEAIEIKRIDPLPNSYDPKSVAGLYLSVILDENPSKRRLFFHQSSYRGIPLSSLQKIRAVASPVPSSLFLS